MQPFLFWSCLDDYDMTCWEQVFDSSLSISNGKIMWNLPDSMYKRVVETRSWDEWSSIRYRRHNHILENAIKHSNLQFSTMHIRSSDGYRSIEYQHTFRKTTTRSVGYRGLKADANESVWKERDKSTWTRYNRRLDQRLSRQEYPPTSGRGGICFMIVLTRFTAAVIWWSALYNFLLLQWSDGNRQ